MLAHSLHGFFSHVREFYYVFQLIALVSTPISEEQ